jgi:hypothetical protein
MLICLAWVTIEPRARAWPAQISPREVGRMTTSRAARQLIKESWVTKMLNSP